MNASKILKKLSVKTGVSATALAKKVGCSKAAQIMGDLSALVEEGKARVDTGGRFPVYFKMSGSASVAQKKTAAPATTSITNDVQKKTDKAALPEADAHGFAIKAIKYKGKAMRKITTPDGKHLRIENGQKLLVINGKPEYVVTTPEDVLKSVRAYSMKKGLTVFTVSEMKQNKKITSEKDLSIKDDHLIFMEIKKHNKAA